MTSRSIFIGDVHGCAAELEELLGVLALGPGDRLFFLGDLVDRGPNTLAVIRRVEQLLATYPGSACIAGNHEEKSLRMRDRGRPLTGWALHATEAEWRFLDGLPLYVQLPELGVVIVHGGLFPRFFQKHRALPDSLPDWRRSRDRLADRARRFLRVRAIDDRGEMVALDQTRPHHAHWSAGYDGRAGFCFFGHDPQLSPPEPLRARHATGLDTGCCFGGRLTAAVLGPATAPADAVMVSVEARAQYAEPRRLFQEP